MGSIERLCIRIKEKLFFLASLEREGYTIRLRGEGVYNILPTPRGSSRSPNSAAVLDVLKTFGQVYRIMKV